MAALVALRAHLVSSANAGYAADMIDRSDIIWLGVAAGTSGGLVGGFMLGIGMDLVVNGQPLGLLMVIPGAPVSALIGWLMARRLARQLAT